MCKKVAIMVPVYKVIPLTYEVACFRNLCQKMPSRDIFLVTYDSFDASFYEDIATQNNILLGRKNFPKEWFKDLQGYNRLCMGIELYESFHDYKYLLINQLDTWLFRDELDYWCDRGFDYIGGPWATPISFHGKNVMIGNGGLSLRRIGAFRFPFKYPWLPIYSLRCLWNELNIRSPKSLLTFVAKVFGYNNTFSYWVKYGLEQGSPEDSFWCAGLSWSPFYALKMPSIEEARLFSFDESPSLQFEKNRNQLPFGCHNFHRFEPDTFWSKYIKYDDSGYPIGSDC